MCVSARISGESSASTCRSRYASSVPSIITMDGHQSASPARSAVIAEPLFIGEVINTTRPCYQVIGAASVRAAVIQVCCTSMLRLLLCAVTCWGAVQSTVKIDNDAVRVLSVTYQPHDRSALHAHAGNRVVILLDAGRLATIYEDGRREDQPWKAGEARWVPAGPKHIGENTGSNPLRIVEIELKQPGSPLKRSPQLDPVAID